MANLLKMFLPLPAGFYANRLDPATHEKFAINTRIDNIALANGRPVFAHCFSAGQDAAYLVGANPSLTQGSPQDLREIARKIFEPISPDFERCLTVDPIGMNWGENPHIVGSYSGCKRGKGRPGGVMEMHGGAFIAGGAEVVENEEGASTTCGAIVAAQQAVPITIRYMSGMPAAGSEPVREQKGKRNRPPVTTPEQYRAYL